VVGASAATEVAVVSGVAAVVVADETVVVVEPAVPSRSLHAAAMRRGTTRRRAADLRQATPRTRAVVAAAGVRTALSVGRLPTGSDRLGSPAFICNARPLQMNAGTPTSSFRRSFATPARRKRTPVGR
jgi:hypothetical protein